jgi:hypothetical protein
MRIFKNPWFKRFADKERIDDGKLMDVAALLEAGGADADLGGGVYKQRVARSGSGKSGSYRFIIFFRSGERVFYHYAFAKADRANIDRKELAFLKKTARMVLTMSDEELAMRLADGSLIEVN